MELLTILALFIGVASTAVVKRAPQFDVPVVPVYVPSSPRLKLYPGLNDKNAYFFAYTRETCWMQEGAALAAPDAQLPPDMPNGIGPVSFTGCMDVTIYKRFVVVSPLGTNCQAKSFTTEKCDWTKGTLIDFAQCLSPNPILRVAVTCW